MSGPLVIDVLTPTGTPDEWADFMVYNEETEYEEPGDLSYALSEMCRGTYQADDIMEFALGREDGEEATHLIGLRRGSDGPLVGFLLMRSPPGEDSATVLLVCVSDTVKGEKTSTKLLDHAKEIAAGKKTLVLDAANEELAKKVYEPYGFTRDTTYVSKYYQDSTVRMKLDLSTTGSSRLNRKTRHAKRNRRNPKRRQLRKFTARRR